MKKKFILASILLIQVLILDNSNLLAQTINGRNVKSIKYKEANGATGVFWVSSGTNWVEQNSGGTRYNFREYRARDEWSVYLKDESRNVFIQLDLWRKKVSYIKGSTKQDLYPIYLSFNKNNFTNAGSSTSSSINGKNVSMVYFNGGSYKFQGASKGNMWSENGADGKVKFIFNQQMRDEWSVYLYDPKRNVKIQLDLHRKKVIYSVGTGARTDLYSITHFQ